MQKHTIPFTKKGYLNLENKLKELEKQRPSAVKTLSRARELGDLSENGLYKAAKYELGQIDRNIFGVKRLIRQAAIHTPKDNKTVQIGHEVKVKDGNKTLSYYLVGEYESSPVEHKISNKSPLGYALMGKSIGEEIIVKTPSGNLKLEIISINQ